MPPRTNPALNLILLPNIFILTQLPAEQSIPQDILEDVCRGTGGFVSITRTPEEISIVREDVGGDCSTNSAQSTGEEVHWRCIKVAGPMDFGLTGIMSDLTSPLKVAQISIFAISSWNTDYLLVPNGKEEEAVVLLERDGWVFR